MTKMLQYQLMKLLVTKPEYVEVVLRVTRTCWSVFDAFLETGRQPMEAGSLKRSKEKIQQK